MSVVTMLVNDCREMWVKNGHASEQGVRGAIRTLMDDIRFVLVPFGVGATMVVLTVAAFSKVFLR